MTNSEIKRFYGDPRWKVMNDAKDIDEKMRIATEIHGGSAPWVGEPHRKEWKYKGFDCLIVRNPHGALCGYVAVPATHPYYGLSYHTVHDGNPDLSVHGGLTYADRCQGHICHKVKEGEDDDVWWFGFDTSHAFDWSPTMMRHGHDAYRDIEYVTRHTNALAEQLLEAWK